jgi:VWFA-related protein
MVRAILALACVLLASMAPGQTPAADRISSDAAVRITTVVTGRSGESLTGLTAKDFELREDGVVQALSSVDARKPQPRRIAIFLDEFHVGAESTEAVRRAVHAFVDRQLREDDSAVVLKPLDSLSAIHLTQDRDRLHEAIDTFEGRKDLYTPRTPLERETIGTAPALAEGNRAQVVLSGLRALATRLGGLSGRAAIVLVSEGFSQQPHVFPARALPDAAIVERFANRFDVPVYAFDPHAPEDTDVENPNRATLEALTAQTGGTLASGPDLGDKLDAVSHDLDTGYTLTYTPAHGNDGRFHELRVTTRRKEARVRVRAGYVSPMSAEMRRKLLGDPSAPARPMRALHRSPLIDVWSGVARVVDADGRVVVTWEPGTAGRGVKSNAARVSLTATKQDGTVLFDGMLAPVRGFDGAANDSRAEFNAPTGRVQLDMTILGIHGEKLDTDSRDVEVPAVGAGTLLLPPLVMATRSAREFRAVTTDEHAPPDPGRQFSRTERLVIRVPAYAAGGEQPHVTARLLNRLGQPVRELDALPGIPADVTQFDLPLAPFAPGDYILVLTATGRAGGAEQRIDIRVTG